MKNLIYFYIRNYVIYSIHTMAKIEGKTINELLRVNDITGSEIIPMAVFDEELQTYVTRGITLNDFFKTIYGMIQSADEALSYTNAYLNSYVGELREADERLHLDDEHLEQELRKTNAYVSYNAEGIVKLHNDYHDLQSYTYTNVGYLYNEIGGSTDNLMSYIEANTERIESLGAYTYSSVSDIHERIGYVQSYIEGEIAISYDNLEKEIAYLAAYVEAGDGHIAEEVKELQSYSYANIGALNDSQDAQNATLAYHSSAITNLGQSLAYQSYVNVIQSGHINTIYYENSNDAFNDWSNPDDDNVKPQP